MTYKNANLHVARAKDNNDEYYTYYEDVELEMPYYREELKGKIVYLNTDNERSSFFEYFVNNFHNYELKELIATSLDGYKITYDGAVKRKEKLGSSGEFQSKKCIEILKACDVVITNPPFSLMRMYIDLMYKYNKKFLILATIHAVSYVNVFPYIKSGDLRLGKTKQAISAHFFKKGVGDRAISNAIWLQNIKNLYPQPLKLTCKYNEHDYPQLDNYHAIEVSKVKEIPYDYDGVMAVPTTFLTKYNPQQFEIIGYIRKGLDGGVFKGTETSKNYDPMINGKKKFRRIFIRKR